MAEKAGEIYFDFIKPFDKEQGTLGLELLRRTPPTKTITLPEVPDPKHLSKELRKKIVIDQKNKTITLKGVLYPEEETEVKNLFVAHDVQATWITEVKRYKTEVEEIFKREM